MNIKKIATIIILAIVLISATNAIYAKSSDFSITDALINLSVTPDGLLHVNESYKYSIDGQINGVYRDIPLKDGESIKNLKVSVNGAYPTIEVIHKNGVERIKVHLWADPGHTQKIHDRNIQVTYSYEMENVVTLFSDVGSLQYKLWGEHWDAGVGRIIANVNLPGNKSVTYYLNPQDYNESTSMNGNVIHIVSSKIPKGEFYELQILMPLDDFTNAKYAKHVSENGRAQIEQSQQKYVNDHNFWNSIFNALTIICFIVPVAPIFIYLKYGREPKVDYNGIYERELPYDDSPAVVNALVNNRSDIGKPDMEGFEATIMDLIDRKVFNMEINKSGNTRDLILNLNEDKYSDLSVDEKHVFNLLKTFSSDNILNVSALSSKLNNERNGKLFLSKYNGWENTVENNLKNRRAEYFDDTGTKLTKIACYGGLGLAIVSFFISLFVTKFNLALLGASIFLGIVSVIMICLPEDIFGRWTESGRVYYLKWINFKKFLKDNSLIKEHPPESIAIWNKYLVYGTALGVADEVYKSMKLNVPNIHDDYYSDLYVFHSYSGLIMLDSAFNTGVSAANPKSDGGGFGGVGGGSGGGGGGVF